MSLLAVGTVAFDTIETPFGKADRVIGGAATYITLAASYFTSNLRIVSVVGDDFPEEEFKDMRARGIDLEGLELKRGEKSFFWAGRYHENMNQRDTLTTDLNVLAGWMPKLPESYKETEYLMLGNLTPEIQMSVINQMESRPRVVAMDTMNFWMDVAMDDLKETLKKVDILIINDEEARQLSGAYALIEAAKIIHEMGPKYLVIKKGEHGAFLFHGEKIFYAPALPLPVVKDPTGAGDTFAGGFMGYLAQSGDLSFESLKRAIIYGSTMASFCVEEFSIDRLKTLTKDEISERARSFKNLVSFDI